MYSFMCLQITQLPESFLARGAAIRLIVCVSSLMIGQAAQLVEALFAHNTRIRLLACVYALMRLQAAHLIKLLQADSARKQVFLNFFMRFKTGQLAKLFGAPSAAVRFGVDVNLLVVHQTAQFAESPHANGAFERLDAVVHPLVQYEAI